MAAGRGLDKCQQVLVDGNGDFSARFFLGYGNRTIADMLVT